MQNTQHFSKELLEELITTSAGSEYIDEDEDEKYTVISRTIEDKSRWDTTYKLIFEVDGRYWSIHYDLPSTESSGPREPFDYGNTIAVEVEPYTRTITDYRVKDLVTVQPAAKE